MHGNGKGTNTPNLVATIAVLSAMRVETTGYGSPIIQTPRTPACHNFHAPVRTRIRSMPRSMPRFSPILHQTLLITSFHVSSHLIPVFSPHIILLLPSPHTHRVSGLYTFKSPSKTGENQDELPPFPPCGPFPPSSKSFGLINPSSNCLNHAA